MDATRGEGLAPWIWGVILVGSLVTIMGLAKAGTEIFWKGYDTKLVPPAEGEAPAPGQVPALPILACFGLIGALAMMSLFAGPAMSYADATAAQLYQPQTYIAAVLERTQH
jgi:multicomponent K+:H+ antiporter subunit D